MAIQLDDNDNDNHKIIPLLSSSNKPLRILTILSWIPTFAFSLPHNMNDPVMVLPVIGIIPMTLSACSGILHLTGRKPPSRGISVAIDLFVGCFLLAVFVASCDMLAGTGHAVAADQVVLGTLGAAPMMLNT
jgi:hypothetical protein